MFDLSDVCFGLIGAKSRWKWARWKWTHARALSAKVTIVIWAAVSTPYKGILKGFNNSLQEAWPELIYTAYIYNRSLLVAVSYVQTICLRICTTPCWIQAHNHVAARPHPCFYSCTPDLYLDTVPWEFGSELFNVNARKALNLSCKS